MNTNNTVISLGLNATNEQRQRNVQASAQQKIAYILENRAQIAAYKAQQQLNKEQLAKLALEVITYEGVTGKPLPTAPNANEVTIIKTIAVLNETKQNSVQSKSKLLIDSIASYDSSIAAVEKSIAQLVEELGKLSVEVVTEAQVVG
jgi:hypothetical protein